MGKNGIPKKEEHFFLLNYKMKNLEIKVTKAKNQYLYTKNKKYLDFSLSSGAMILGHSNSIFIQNLKKQSKLGSNYSVKI